ncbi:MAG: glycosyltransferase family 39 protein [Deltaproteobacteria bacterium]|nr:glycosyltransferase family 39 protein [Deltaproteobacteria bacterium]
MPAEYIILLLPFNLLNFMVEKNHQYALALFSICCLGFAFRIYNINVSLWCDEMMQAVAASAEWQDVFDIMTGYCSSPPLDYIIMKIVILCFGQADWVLRMPAVLFGIASIPVFYFFSRSLVEQKTALTASALLALSPFAIAYSQEARMYSIFLFLSLLSFIAALRLAEKNSFRHSMLLGIINGLLVLAHYFGIFVIAYEIIFFMAVVLYSGEKKRRIELLMISLLISFFFFLPWLPFLLSQLVTYGGKELGYALNADSNFFKIFLSSFSTDKSYLDGWAYSYLLIFLSSIVIAGYKKEKKILFVALGVFLILGTLFGLNFFKKMVTPRNAIFLLPLFLFICAYGITSALNFFKINFKLSIAVSILLVLWPAVLYHRAGPKGHKQPWKEVSEYIRQHPAGKEKIFITDPVDRGFLAYYADPEATCSVMKKDWSVYKNDPSWKIWVIDEAVITAMREKRFSGWVVAPSFLMGRTYNDYFFKNYRQLLSQLLGPPVKQFYNQAGPLQLFHVQAAP